jgi:putative hemolysin
MGESSIWNLGLSIVSLLGSMFASFSELSIFTVDKIKLYRIVKKSKDGKYLKKLLKAHRETLVVILFVNLLFNVSFSIFAQNLVSDWRITTSAIVSTILITIVLTLFGEVLPKVGLFSLAEVAVVTVSKVVYFVSILLKPVIFLVNRGIINPLSRVLSSPRKNIKSYTSKLPEILKRNLRGSKLHKIASIVNSDVRELMIPYNDFLCIPVNMVQSSILRKIKDLKLKSNYAVVYQDSRNNVVGCISLTRLLYVAYQKKEIWDYVEPVMFVAETKGCYELFREMKTKGLNVAIVVDEYGNIIGVIERGTVLLELFSDIEVEKIGNGYVLRGDTTIEEFNDYFGLDEDSKSYHTISGLIIEKVGRIPNVGEEIEFDDFVVKIVDVKQGRIGKVMIKKKN